MFAISDVRWPGISKLVEEAGEVSQVCGKLMATRGEIHHWDGTNLADRLEEELADLRAAITFVIKHCELDRTKIDVRTANKLALFEEWHEKGQ